MTGEENFDELEIEAFKELGNVGAAKSANALTILLHRHIDMSIPYVKSVELSEIKETLELTDNEEIGFATLDVSDPMQYRISVIFKFDAMAELSELLLSTSSFKDSSINDMNTLQISMLEDIASNILLKYLAAINKMLETESMPLKQPRFQIIQVTNLLEKISFEKLRSPNFLLIQLDLFTEDRKFECQIFLQPHPNHRKEFREAFAF